MRRLRINKDKATTENHEIREAAATYYRALFEDYNEEDMKDRHHPLCANYNGTCGSTTTSR